MRTNTLPSQQAIEAPKSKRPRAEAVSIAVAGEEDDIHRRPTLPRVKTATVHPLPFTERITVRALPATSEPPSVAHPTLDRLRAAPPPAAALALGSLEAVPSIKMLPRYLRARSSSQEEAFVLRLIDGRRDIETILDSCPLETREVLAILASLLQAQVIGVRQKTPATEC